MTRVGARFVCTMCLDQRAAASRDRLNEARDRSARIAVSQQIHRPNGIPIRFAGLNFESIGPATARNDKVVSAMKGLCQNFETQRQRLTGLIFIGPPGCGKTHLASVMANQLMTTGHLVVYRSLPNLMQEFRAAFRQVDAHEGLMEYLVSADMLILDEIDLHGRSDHDYALIFDLINRRYERPGRPTLCISNRSLEHLRVDLDERITTRVLGSRQPIYWDACNHRAETPS